MGALLRAKQEKFVDKFLLCGNAAEAYSQAGGRATKKSIHSAASRFLASPGVQTLLKDRLPQRDASEQNRVYSELIQSVTEAKERYQRAKERTALASNEREKIRFDQIERKELRILIDSRKLLATAAGLMVRLRIDTAQNPQEVRVLSQRVIIVDRPSVSTKKAEHSQASGGNLRKIPELPVSSKVPPTNSPEPQLETDDTEEFGNMLFD